MCNDRNCPCNDVPEDIYDFNIFHLKYKFHGNPVIKFYAHDIDQMFYQTYDKSDKVFREGADSWKEAKTLFEKRRELIPSGNRNI